MQFINTFHTSLPALVMSHFNGVTQHGKGRCYIGIKINISKGKKRKKKRASIDSCGCLRRGKKEKLCSKSVLFFFKTASLSKSN